MRKIDAYKIKTGANLASSNFWNAILEDIDLRVHARELDAEAINKAADELIAVGIARVNVTFNPLIQQSTQAMQDAIALLNAAQAQVSATIDEVNEDLQAFLDETALQVQAILAGGVDGGTTEDPGAKIKLLHSSTAGHVPAALDLGEFAINHADGLLFYRTAAGGVGSVSLPSLATQEWVTDQFTALKGGVATAYDTLQEIAAWIATSDSAAAALATAIGNRLRFDAAQALDAGQKTQLFTNAGLGAAAAKAIATVANIRANSGADVIATDAAWGAAEQVDLGNKTGAVAIDLSTGVNFKMTLTGNVTITFTNGKYGQSGSILFVQDGTGSRTVSWGAGASLVGQTAPSVNTAATTGQTFVSYMATGATTAVVSGGKL